MQDLLKTKTKTKILLRKIIELYKLSLLRWEFLPKMYTFSIISIKISIDLQRGQQVDSEIHMDMQ